MPSDHQIRTALLALLLGGALIATRGLSAQIFDIGPLVVDTAQPPITFRPTAILPGAILPRYRVIAFYGNPSSKGMGILGEIPPDQMMARLESTAAEWGRADTSRGVMPALHLIVTVAQGRPGADGMYRLRMPDSQIAEVASWAEKRGWLLFLDVQVGRSKVPIELERLIPWLKKPWVHLALDPEFAMPADQVPGKRIGTLDARDINYAVNFLAHLVQEERLPPKMLVVHRFTIDMLTNYKAIISDPRVQVVINSDGFGAPANKANIFGLVVTRRQVQFAGLKLFYHNDHPMMSLAQILALRPIPIYIQYQ